MTTALAVTLLVAEETHAEGGFPAAGWGIGAGLILFLLLIGTLSFGKGREHS